MNSHDNRLGRDLKIIIIHPYPVSVSAAGPRLFLWCLPVHNLKGAVLRWRVDYGGFPLSLQLGGHSNDNVLHLVLLVQHFSVGPHVWARVRRVFGGGLKEHHVASLGETHGPLLAHLAVRAAGVAEVTLIPHQEPEAETEIMLLFQPLLGQLHKTALKNSNHLGISCPSEFFLHSSTQEAKLLKLVGQVTLYTKSTAWTLR